MLTDLLHFSWASMMPVLTAIAWALIHFLWEGVLLGGASGLVLIFLRKEKPQSRYLFCCIALFACLLLPIYHVLNFFLFGADNASSIQFIVVRLFGEVLYPEFSSLVPKLNTYVNWIIVPWAFGVMILSGRLLTGLSTLSAFHTEKSHQIEPVWQNNLNRVVSSFRLKRKVIVRAMSHLPSPITIGILKPLILLPTTLFSGMPSHFIEALLAHELAHIQRHDYLLNLVQRAIETMLFFHPVVWWLSGIIRNEREQIADEIAANVLGDSRGLALALQQLDRLQYTSAHLAQAANGGALKARIRRLVYSESGGKARRPYKTWIGVGMLFCTLYVCAEGIDNKSRNVHRTLQSKNKLSAYLDFTQCKPEYPKSSLKNNEEGTVTLDILIGKDDRVHATKIFKSSGSQGLDQAVIASLIACQSGPKAALVDNEKTDAWLRVAYVWKLE